MLNDYENGVECGFLGTIINNEQYHILSFDKKLKEFLIHKNPQFKRFIDSDDIIGIKNLIRREKAIHMQQNNLVIDGRTYSLMYLFDLSIEQELSKQLQEKSYEAHLRMEIFNQMKDALLITDEQNIVLFVNHAFVNMLLIQPADIVGMPLTESTFGRTYCNDMLRHRHLNSTLMTFDNHRRCIVTCSPIFDVDHQLRRMIVTLRDAVELETLLGSSPSSAPPVSLVPRSDQGGKPKPRDNALPNTAVNAAMRKIYEEVNRLADIDSTVLLTGETGVGKDYVATYIHEKSQRSQTGKFIKLNCGAIPEPLFESELFGYEEGAFTGARKGGKKGYFENANNGTLFLDEIGEMPYLMQVKLLSALNDKEFYRVGGTKPIAFTARVIAATNADLSEMIKQKKFRSDLFYRINVITFEIPPLRSRKDEILVIAQEIMRQYNTVYAKNCYLNPLVMNAFLKYGWPGNIREMKNLIERLVVIAPTDCIGIDELPDAISKCVDPQHMLPPERIPSHDQEIIVPTSSPQEVPVSSAVPPEMPVSSTTLPDLSAGLKLKEMVEQYETDVLTAVLANSRSLKEAAERLGIDISTIVRKKQKYNIP